MSFSFFSSRGTSRSFASVLKVVGIAILVIGVVLAFGGCGGKASIVGKWHSASEAETIQFTDDGKMIVTSDSGDAPDEYTYKVDGSKLTVSFMGQSATTDFTLAGGKLTVTNLDTGEPVTYDQVK